MIESLDAEEEACNQVVVEPPTEPIADAESETNEIPIYVYVTAGVAGAALLTGGGVGTALLLGKLLYKGGSSAAEAAAARATMTPQPYLQTPQPAAQGPESLVSAQTDSTIQSLPFGTPEAVAKQGLPLNKV